MNRAGRVCKILASSKELVEALKVGCCIRHLEAESVLFDEGEKNYGVFLICSGIVRLRVPGVRQLDRFFSTGSVLGLPSTFTGNAYSLTATCITDCEFVQVAERQFLQLMIEQPNLCREATSILSAEVAFILSAMGKRPPRIKLEIGGDRTDTSRTPGSARPSDLAPRFPRIPSARTHDAGLRGER
jgi:CRP-like cAMP-binding protein